MFSLYHNWRWLLLSSKVILNLVKRFEESGSVQNRNRGKSGRRSRVDAATVDAVAAAVQHGGGNTSVKRVSGQLRLSCSTTYRIMRSLLHLYPYKTQVLQAQRNENVLQHLQCCQMMSQREDIHGRILFNYDHFEKLHVLHIVSLFPYCSFFGVETLTSHGT